MPHLLTQGGPSRMIRPFPRVEATRPQTSGRRLPQGVAAVEARRETEDDMGEIGNAVGTGPMVQQAGGGTGTAAGSGAGAGTTARPGTGTETELPPPQGRAGGGGGQQADQKNERLFTHPDGSRLTPDELREEAAADRTHADGLQNRLDADRAGLDADEIADGQARIDHFREQADVMGAEASRLDQAQFDAEMSEPERPSGSITNPDGTSTEIERLPDGTSRETTFDSEGNEISSRRFERMPGQSWARNEPTDKG